MDTLNYFLPISKVEKNSDGSRTVTGYASTERKDLDGEIVSLDAVKSALPAYMEWRNIRQMHQSIPIGVAKEASLDEHGLFLTSRIVDANAIMLLDNEVLKGYSIGGKKLAKKGNVITEIELVEISLVDRPANPDCRIDVTKMAKEASIVIGELDLTVDKPEAEVSFLRKMVTSLLGTAKSPIDAQVMNAFTKSAMDLGDFDYAILCKREFSDKERSEAAADGSAMPGGGYPIKSEQDLKNAVQAFGRAKDKDATKKHIISRAKSLKATQHLPADWEGSTKEEPAKKFAVGEWDEDLFGPAPSNELVKVGIPPGLVELVSGPQADEILAAPVLQRLRKGMQTVGDLCYAFASIRGAQRRLIMEGMIEKDGDDKALADKLGSIASELASVISEKAGHEGSEALFLTDEDDLTFYGFNGNMGVIEMADNATDLAKRASAKVKECVGKAAGHLRKAGKANMEAKKCFGKAAKMFGEKMKKAASASDDDKEMMKLMKSVHDAMGESQDHMEMAHGALGKAASGWVGQREQGAMTAGEGYEENPKFVEGLPQSEMTEGEVPWYEADEPYANKAARVAHAAPADGMVTKETAELMAKNARLEATVEALNKSPANPRRGVNFAPEQVGLESGDAGQRDLAKMLDGVDVSAENAAGHIIGNMIAGKMGKSVLFDPNFRGQAGLKR